MRGLRIPLLIVTILSFAFGIFWGVKIQRAREEAEGRLRAVANLRVLSLPGLLSPQLLQSFQKRESIRADVTLAASPEELFAKLEHESYDAAFLFSDQASSAAATGMLDKLDASNLALFNQVSPDFLPSENDPAKGYSVPLLWAVTGFLVDPTAAGQPLPSSWSEAFQNARLKNSLRLLRWSASLRPLIGMYMPDEAQEVAGAWRKPLGIVKSTSTFEKTFRQPISDEDLRELKLIQTDHSRLAFASKTAAGWKFVLPSEGATLWILSVVIPRSSARPPEVRKFVDYLLERTSALEMTRSAQAGSTLKSVEDSGLHYSLKPSHLRSFPLTKLRNLSGAADMLEARAIYDSL